jgi:hypothetical protein
MTIPKWILTSIHLLAWAGKEHLNPRSPYFWRIRKIKGSTVAVCLNPKNTGLIFSAALDFRRIISSTRRLTADHDEEIDVAK